VLESEIENFYHGFLDVVATGRGRSRDEVHAVAQGRVWSGRDAKEKGLVDELGDGRAALAALKSRVPESAKMQVVAIRAPWQRQAPLPPAAQMVAKLFGMDGTAIAIAFSRERVLAFSLLPSFY